MYLYIWYSMVYKGNKSGILNIIYTSYNKDVNLPSFVTRWDEMEKWS